MVKCNYIFNNVYILTSECGLSSQRSIASLNKSHYHIAASSLTSIKTRRYIIFFRNFEANLEESLHRHVARSYI